MTLFGIHLWQIVIIGGFGFVLGFFLACLLASAGMASRDRECGECGACRL
jgi:hypothetical protein